MLVVNAKKSPGTFPSVAAATTIFDGLIGLTATHGSVSLPLSRLMSVRLVPTVNEVWAKAAEADSNAKADQVKILAAQEDVSDPAAGNISACIIF